MKTTSLLFTVLLGVSSACTITSHESKPVQLGTPRNSSAMTQQLEQPGPIELTTVVSSDWAISRAGLINLDAARAKAAKLDDGDEPIQVYFHVLNHPQHGTFIVDTGVETALRDAPDKAVLSGMLASVMGVEKMKVKAPLGAWLREHQIKLSGVLLTHLHSDHISGMPDVPKGTPIYVGPGEATQRSFLNVFAQGATDDLLEGQAPLQELTFAKDNDGRFAGVLDVFGDGSLWALHMPGHTPGSLAFVARTTHGPVLLTGDTCHTAWGWHNDVEPGAFTSDHQANRDSLAQLRKLAREHATLSVRLGHQQL